MQNICKRLLQKKRLQKSCFPVNFEKLLIIRFYQNTLDSHHSRQDFNPRATHASLFFCHTPKFYGSLPPTPPMQKLDPRHPLTQAPTLPTSTTNPSYPRHTRYLVDLKRYMQSKIEKQRLQIFFSTGTLTKFVIFAGVFL